MTRFTKIAFSLSLFASAGPAAAQTLTVGPNVNINRQAGYQAETSITINRANPNQVFAWSNDVNGFARNSAAFSTDGGQTWTPRFTGSDGWPALGGDPTSSGDNFGNIYAASFNSAFSAILVGRSTDGGQTFTQLTSFTGGGIDQPTITAGQSAVWATYRTTTGVVARGATSTALGTTGSFGAAQAVPGSGSGNFGDIAIGPGGRVAVAYQTPSGGVGPSTIFVNVDADGLGAGGFSAAGAGVATNVGGFRPIPAQPSRTVDSEAGLAYDATGGPRNGRLYLVYTDAPTTTSNDLNIFVRSSTNDGATWSAPVRVNTDAGSNSQFFPKIALDPTSGNIAVVWYDARNDPNNQNVELWGTVSLDGGASFLPEVKISAGATRGIGLGGGNELGDYIGLDFYNNVFLPCWTDTSNSTGDNPNGTTNSDYYTARVSLTAVPEPATVALLVLTVGGAGYWSWRRFRRARQFGELSLRAARTTS